MRHIVSYVAHSLFAISASKNSSGKRQIWCEADALSENEWEVHLRDQGAYDP